jgi:hypothetical protein
VGKSRAEIATKVLLELNSDVRGDYVDESVEQLLNNSPDFFSNFTVVYAVSLPERQEKSSFPHTYHKIIFFTGLWFPCRKNCGVKEFL